MITNSSTKRPERPGIVLLITLILLVVMATMGYMLTSRVSNRRYRNQYIIDYSKARYSCDSAVKYALATLQEIVPYVISRPNEPDFSDLYALDTIGYINLLKSWSIGTDSSGNGNKQSDNINALLYSYYVRGPYGPEWPFVTEPVEFTIDSANVRIEIQDENAKYPLGWTLINNNQIERERNAGFLNFCEMMGMEDEIIITLRNQLNEIGRLRVFKVAFAPITTTTRQPMATRSGGGATTASQIVRSTKSVSSQIKEQTINFSNLFHCTLLDLESLSKVLITAGPRQESALKYMGVWGSYQVNINTAPRHVLEAAFIFGGNEVSIAEEIIQARRIKPFESVAELKQTLSTYSDSIEKCEQFITTSSTLFTIKITAVSGIAEASTILAVTKQDMDIQRIALINSY